MQRVHQDLGFLADTWEPSRGGGSEQEGDRPWAVERLLRKGAWAKLFLWKGSMNPPADTWVVRDSRFIQHKLTAADFEVRRVKQLALGHQAKKWPR